MATAIALAALLALGLGRGAHAATLTVVNTNDSGAVSLRQAIADAVAGDTIGFSPALSGQTITLTVGELLISKNLTITGPAGGITVSGNNASRVFETSGATVNLSHLVIANGSAAVGGGIFNGGSLTLTNSTVSGTAPFGGGIFNDGSLTLTNSTVNGDSALDEGGDIYSFSLTLTVANSTISGNHASVGGGISNHGTGPDSTNITTLRSPVTTPT